MYMDTFTKNTCSFFCYQNVQEEIQLSQGDMHKMYMNTFAKKYLLVGLHVAQMILAKVELNLWKIYVQNADERFQKNFFACTFVTAETFTTNILSNQRQFAEQE